MRAPLVAAISVPGVPESAFGLAHTSLSSNLGLLIEQAASAGVAGVLHLSSIAAVDHLRPQRFHDEGAPLPPLSEYCGAYDVFKRQSEDIITLTSERFGLRFTHLRIGAIFSNDDACIQCNALRYASWPVATYVETRMDCNSSRNVSVAISAILARLLEPAASPAPPVLFYTRAAAQGTFVHPSIEATQACLMQILDGTRFASAVWRILA